MYSADRASVRSGPVDITATALSYDVESGRRYLKRGPVVVVVAARCGGEMFRYFSSTFNCHVRAAADQGRDSTSWVCEQRRKAWPENEWHRHKLVQSGMFPMSTISKKIKKILQSDWINICSICHIQILAHTLAMHSMLPYKDCDCVLYLQTAPLIPSIGSLNFFCLVDDTKYQRPTVLPLLPLEH